jgi:PAS domain S-box-containing protein
VFQRVIHGLSDLEVVSNDAERILWRGQRAGDKFARSPVLVVLPAAEHPTSAILDRLAHEYELRAILEPAWAARPIELLHWGVRPTLLLEDPGGEPLERLVGEPMEPGRFLRLAASIAAALAKVHERRLVHKDLKPANILVHCADGLTRFTGFGIASRLPRERPALNPPETIAGSLAYMAPEQTGRMNRSIDSRSDLYALGVTFYRMLTGLLPFSAADPMEWVHCHLARTPLTPSERVGGVPPPVSDIIMRLLGKTAEERYQTASGLEHDLKRCLSQWEQSGRIEPFLLGERDTPDRLLIPEKLYGRERDVEALVAVVDRVAKGGGTELVLVSGYSGIGKSSVVNELHRALVPPRGLFVAGKFEQHKRNIPYSTLAQAFQSLVRMVLTKGDAEFATWREAFRDALGPNGRLVADLVPELMLVVGEQPPVAEIEPQQAKARFQLTLRRFVSVFAQPEHPLVLFLDDLQWLDAATLDLIGDLLTQADVGRLMFIGAYRDNEVDADHPLVRKLAAIRGSRSKVSEIKLRPLGLRQVAQLVADTVHATPEDTEPLAELVHAKTSGNPFFVIQFLHALAEEGLLVFDHQDTRWTWDVDRIHAKGYTDNVADLMVAKLARLPARTQRALRDLACLGAAADAAKLAIASFGAPEDKVDADLWEAVRAELIERLPHAYKFTHDRVQEAAYSLIPAEDRAATHLRIGRLLAAHIPPEDRDEAIFDIVNQLNAGATLIISQHERDQLAEFNLIAGQRAKSSAAYVSALNYLAAGARLFSDDIWKRRHQLVFRLERDRAECEFLVGALAESERRLANLAGRAENAVERAAVACLRLDLYMVLDGVDRAIEIGLEYLRSFGLNWSPHPTADEARRAFDRTRALLRSRAVDELFEQALLTDPASLATLDVLTKLVPPAFWTDENLEVLVLSEAATLSLERGVSDGSSLACAWLGLSATVRFGDDDVGQRLAQLGYDLVDRRGLVGFAARTFSNHGRLLGWTRGFRPAGDAMQRTIDVANKAGDLTYAAYASMTLVTLLLLGGEPLVDVQRSAADCLAFTRRIGFSLVVDVASTQLALVETLRGLTRSFGSFDSDRFQEARAESHFARRPIECWYWIRKLQARYLAGDNPAAVAAAARAERLVPAITLSFEMIDYWFYSALSRAASCASASADERASHLEAIRAHYSRLNAWAEKCPESFESRAVLVAAEIARVEDRPLDAERLYEEAIRSAGVNGFVHIEALANELASRSYAERGFDKIARTYLRDARYGYLRWGADGKVGQLEALHPWLQQEAPPPAPGGAIGAPVEQLDLATVIKVSQAISSEIVFEKLIDTLMRTAIEQAGAERGLLFLARTGALKVAAEATTPGDTVTVRLRDDRVAGDALPESMLHYVQRTLATVILDDAAAGSAFAADPYILARRARSVLCLPLANQSRLVGVLYLENNLASSVFSPARIGILNVLASQAAISLENARLYRELTTSEERWRNLFESVPVGVSIVGLDKRYVAANPAFQKMIGYSEEELCGLTPVDITHEDDRASTEAIMAAQLAGRPYVQHREKRYRRKDGNMIWTEVDAFLAPVAGSPPLLAGVAVDITERKRAEDALRESEEQWKAVFENNPTMYFMVDAANRILSVNPFGATQLGYAPEELVGRPVQILIHEADRDYALRNRAERLKHLGRTASWELRRVRKDGSIIWTRDTGRAMLIKNRPVVLVASEDITEARRATEALREVQAQLARANRLEAMGQLTASIAHEVNQPIGATVTNAQAGLRWLRFDPPELDEIRQALERIVRDGVRAGAVVQRIRNLVKKSQVREELVEINAVVREVGEVTRSEATKNGVSMRTELGEGLPLVRGDRIELQQVILNLILNAIEAMTDLSGGERQLLIATGKTEAGDILVAVHDSGPGLAPAVQENLFRAFYTTKPNGLGLGLSICRSIVESHGGRLWASPETLRGAVFQFTLPPHPGDSSLG